MSRDSRSETALPMRALSHKVMVYLRRCGVVVHQVTPMPTPANGERSVVVFLSKTMDQSDIARKAVLRVPGVQRATLAGYSPTVMFVYLNADPRSQRP